MFKTLATALAALSVFLAMPVAAQTAATTKFQSECFEVANTSKVVFSPTNPPPAGAAKLLVSTGSLLVVNETPGTEVWIRLSTNSANAVVGQCTDQWPLNDLHPVIELALFDSTVMTAIDTSGTATIRWAVTAW